jgi:hypothetical protein
MFENLLNKIWATRGCRFQAHKRLNEVNNWSLWTTNILTVYIISLSILALSPPSSYNFLAGKTGSVFMICLSIAILLINVLESSKNYKIRADSMHRCAKELSSIYNEICLIQDDVITTLIPERIIEIANKYQNIIDKYDDNHTDLDYRKFQAINFSVFKLTKFQKTLIDCQYFFLLKGVYIILIIAPVLIFIKFYQGN